MRKRSSLLFLLYVLLNFAICSGSAAQNVAPPRPMTLPPEASTRIALRAYEKSKSLPGCQLKPDNASQSRSDDDLDNALRKADYTEFSWYLLGSHGFLNKGDMKNDSVDVKGFAMITQLEQIDENGHPAPGKWRWSKEPYLGALPHRSAFLTWLLGPPPARFRVFMFWVVAVSEQQEQGQQKTGDKITIEEWNAYLAGGTKEPPSALEGFNYSNTNAFVYVYEYKRSNVDGSFAPFKSGLSTEDHMKAVGLWQDLCLQK